MASELFQKGNDQFIYEQYEKAITLYTQALELERNRDDIFCNRAQAYFKLEKYKETVEDASEALRMNSSNVKAYHRKGTGLFYLEDYVSAKEAFEAGLKYSESKAEIAVSKGDNPISGFKIKDEDSFNFPLWIKKCEAEIDLQKNGTGVEQGVGVSEVKQTSGATAEPMEVKQEVPPEPVKPTIRHDWYQTPTHVIVNIFYKNCKQEDASIDIQDRLLQADLVLPDREPYQLKFSPLAHPIDPSASSYKILKTKIEVKMKKREGLQWKVLESEDEEAALTLHPATDPQAYPTSAHYTRNWDKLSKQAEEEEKKEKKEGDAALNELFQQIYKDGTDETKKAMMKSFYESGGTVLSTNWGEIGKAKTEVKPPDGMEFKKWNS